MLPRQMVNSLHHSMTKKTYERGATVCREGEQSLNLHIILKGEFEVSKVVDMKKVDQASKLNSQKPHKVN